MNTKDIPQFDAAFPQELQDETAYWPGLSKLEYAAIHIAAELGKCEIDDVLNLHYDKKELAELSVEYARAVLEACE